MSKPPRYVINAVADLTHWMNQAGITDIVILSERVILIPPKNKSVLNKILKLIRYTFRALCTGSTQS